MPISYLFKGNLLMFKARGAVTVKEFYLAWNKASGDPSFQRPIDALIDLREAQVDVPGQEIEDIVYRLKKDRLFKKMVFVAERGSFTYAMGRMFCINAEYVGCRSEIFLNMVDALAWLDGGGMNDDSAAPIDAS